MRYAIGAVMIVIGLAQLAFRGPLAQTNAARQRRRWGADSHLGRFGGSPGAERAGRRGAALGGGLIAVAGVLVIAGVFGSL